MAALIDLSKDDAASGLSESRAAQSPATLAALYAELVRLQWSTDALRALLPQALLLAATLLPDERADWLGGLRFAWSSGTLRDAAACTAARALAECWYDWPMVDALSGVLSALRSGGIEAPADEESAWISALFRSGRTDEALQRCRRRMFLHPWDVRPAHLHAELCAWRAFLESRAQPIEGDGLLLEPLGHQHLGDFAWQFHDPAIAELCCLPKFRSDREWHAWLDRCWGYGDQRLYAVLHAEWGFVGSVSLIQHDGVGFFYYWLGPDFQGHGLGPVAVRLLLGAARARDGMTACYAKVFERNRRSRRALERLGFAALDFLPAPPHHEERFYRLGQPQERDTSVAELRRLLAQMGSEARIAVPARARAVVGRRTACAVC